MDEFDQFWAAYPKKRAKGAARRAWIKTADIRPPIAELLAALECAKASVEWHKAGRESGVVGEYIPHPSSWLHAEGWEDEYTVRLPSIGRPAAQVKSEPLPPPPTEEQKAAARAALAQFRLKSVI